MPKLISDFIKGYVFCLSEDNYSFSQIQKRLKSKNVDISKFSISKIIKENKESFGICNQAIKRKLGRNRKPELIQKIKTFVTKENPLSQRNIAVKTNTSQSTVYRIINQNLG
jgi:DNA invertase Pin-like site-specific DNA recombinase